MKLARYITNAFHPVYGLLFELRISTPTIVCDLYDTLQQHRRLFYVGI